MMGKVVCAVCGKHIRDEPRLKPSEISHGYCQACFEQAMKAVDEMIESEAKKDKELT